jgi:hypothetical protein
MALPHNLSAGNLISMQKRPQTLRLRIDLSQFPTYPKWG